nr:CDP-glycerol glycerophosphotransferase family protein [Bacteroidota bacterium]
IVNGFDISSYLGVSLGRVGSNDKLEPVLIPILKNILYFDSLRRKFDSLRIVIGEGVAYRADLWVFLCKFAGIQATVLEGNPSNPGLKKKSGMIFEIIFIKSYKYILLRTADIIKVIFGKFKKNTNKVIFYNTQVMLGSIPSESRIILQRNGYKLELASKWTTVFQRVRAEKNTHHIQGEKAVEGWPLLLSKNVGDKDQLFSYLGYNFFPFIEKWLQTQFYDIFKSYLHVIDIINETLEVHRPLAILTQTKFSGYEVAWALVAQQKKIPVIAVAHEHLVTNIHGHKPLVVADYILSDGELNSEWYNNMGYASSQVYQVSPVRRKRIEAASFTDDKIRNLNLPENKFVILYADQRSGTDSAKIPVHHHFRNLSMCLNAAKEFQEYHFLIKFHPETGREGHDAFLRRKELIESASLSNVQVVPTTFNFADVLYASDLLITSYSTAIIEAMMMDKPIICFQSEFFFDAWPGIAKTNCVKMVDDYDNLIHELKHISGLKITPDIRAQRKSYINYIWNEGPELHEVMLSILSKEQDAPDQLTIK